MKSGASTRLDESKPKGGEGEPLGRGPCSEIEQGVLDALHTCFDPEIPVDIVELGLVYCIDVAADGEVMIDMTLTAPACPVAEALPREIEAKVRAVPGVHSAKVRLVWDPPWNHTMMSEGALLELGLL